LHESKNTPKEGLAWQTSSIQAKGPLKKMVCRRKRAISARSAGDESIKLTKTPRDFSALELK
jgi:hypothetical protein